MNCISHLYFQLYSRDEGDHQEETGAFHLYPNLIKAETDRGLSYNLLYTSGYNLLHTSCYNNL